MIMTVKSASGVSAIAMVFGVLTPFSAQAARSTDTRNPPPPSKYKALPAPGAPTLTDNFSLSPGSGSFGTLHPDETSTYSASSDNPLGRGDNGSEREKGRSSEGKAQ